MVRNLALVSVWLAAILPGWVHALGLGEIQLNSFLNQPLDAQIEIISTKRGEADGLKVKLASQEAFTRSGLEFTSTLRQLKFKLIKKNGRHYIKVTTSRSYREPFLNFLLEANWSNGRIVREYAALVDPPTMVQATPAQTQVPASRQATPSRATASSKPSQPALFGRPQGVEGSGFIGDTYTTQRQDTAWKIAKQVAPADVSTEQAMMAILRANPQAFINQNINRLKAGYVLNIPDQDSMLSQSHAEARAEVRRQARAWRNRNKPTETASRGRLEILPPKAGSVEQSKQAGSSAGSGDTHREAMLAREAAEAQRQENAELRMRVSELEEQINNAKRLANLKAEQLAALEKKLAEMGVAQPKAPVEPAAPAETAKPEVPPVAEEKPVVPEAPAEKPVEVAKKQWKQVPAVAAEPGTPINQHVVKGFKQVDISKLPKSPLPQKPFKTGTATAAKTADKAPADEGLMAQVMGYMDSNPLMFWVVVGSGGFVVLLIIMMVTRRRKEQMFEESILQDQAYQHSSLLEEHGEVDESEAKTEEFFETVDVDEATEEATQVDEATDTSFLSDMVMSDMSDLEGEATESDPLTEADVFLAYGRFGPAETMIKNAIENEPERNDLRLKLLEIYYSAKNKDDFESEAAAFNNDLQANPDPDTWNKVVEMGSDLCPNNPLFSGGGSAASVAEVETPAGAEEEDTEIMDFDLGEFESQIDSLDTADATEPMDKAEDTGLDLDLDALSAGEETVEDTLEITAELEGIADTLGDSGSASSTDEITQELDTNKPDEQEITQELEVGSGNTSLNQEITEELEVPDLAAELDLDETAESTIPMDDLDMDEDVLAEIDEVGTKLDLARAYIDMGDPEGARSILNEVVEEGNDSQKSEAESLMSQI